MRRIVSNRRWTRGAAPPVCGGHGMDPLAGSRGGHHRRRRRHRRGDGARVRRARRASSCSPTSTTARSSAPRPADARAAPTCSPCAPTSATSPRCEALADAAVAPLRRRAHRLQQRRRRASSARSPHATHADWEYTMRVNFWGVVHGVETFVPRLIAQRPGRPHRQHRLDGRAWSACSGSASTARPSSRWSA